MKKKNYDKPRMRVYTLSAENTLLQNSGSTTAEKQDYEYEEDEWED